AAEGQNVIGVPGEIGCKIGSFDLVLAQAGIVQRHQQSGAVVKIRGDFGKAIALRKHAGDDVVADSPDRAVVVREQSGLDLFVLGGAAVLVSANKGDFLADVFVQEFGRL